MLCTCGCGQTTKINTKTRGDAKRGEPQKYIRGHWARGPRVTVEPPNPSGLCQCGCGKPAPIAVQTDVKLGYLAGHPTRFIRGHAGTRHRLDESLWTVKDRGFETACRVFNGKPDQNGYCHLKFKGRYRLAHRAFYEQEVGPIPKGHDVDHLCSQRDCVNPTHLEAVTRSENITRSVRRGRTPAKLNIELARLIRASDLNAARVAELLSVSKSTVDAVREGRAWVE